MISYMWGEDVARELAMIDAFDAICEEERLEQMRELGREFGSCAPADDFCWVSYKPA